MGQKQSANFLSDDWDESLRLPLLTEELHSLTYEKFIAHLAELNALSKSLLDSDGKQLIFAVKKGTDSTVFWKATVQIACVKIDPQTQHVFTYRLLSLNEFLKVFKTLKCHTSAQQQCQSTTSNLDVSEIIHNFNDSNNKQGEYSKECCICLEREHEVILPCMHSYCLPCIEQWNDLHDTCPICREKLESTDDTWVISEVPRAEEISQEIQSSLMKLSEHKDPACVPF